MLFVVLKNVYFIKRNIQRERIGIVESKWKPAQQIEDTANEIRDSWKFYCDNPPRVKLNGHTEAQFPYIPMGVNYVLQEILKNSFRLLQI